MNTLDRRLCVAPMLDWTDRHCRYFLRLFSPHMLLYTEMIVAQAVLRGNRERLLAFDPAEHPVALQLGGADPKRWRRRQRWRGRRLRRNQFQCRLSQRPRAGRELRRLLDGAPGAGRDCVRAMRAAVEVPVTIKCRTGIDDLDSYEFLRDFVATIAPPAVTPSSSMPARRCWRTESKQNRDVPPLDHARSGASRELPQLTIIINGGLRTVLQVTAQFAHVDGAMLGREAYHNPFVLAELHRAIYADDFIPPEPAVVVAAMQTTPSARSPPVRRYGRSRATCWGCWWPTRRARPRHALTEGVSRPGATPALLPAALRAALTPTQ